MKTILKYIIPLFLFVWTSVSPGTAEAFSAHNNIGASVNTSSDVVIYNNTGNSFAYSKKPVASYTGPKGVTIRSYSSTYPGEDSLKKVYDELMNNGNGEEIAYLSYVDLIGDYPYGKGTAGKWYGSWENGMLAKGRYIELYGCDKMTFAELARTLSHEYGHHFTFYYLSKKEGIDANGIMNSGFAKIRNLSSYKDIQNGEHMWEPSEIAADDYTQFFGSSTARESTQFKDVRDVARSHDTGKTTYNTLVYNLSPQENVNMPLAWQVPGLYNYWSGLSGIKAKNEVPPEAPFLALTSVSDDTLTFKWSQSVDDNTENMEYTLVGSRVDDNSILGIRTTSDSNGRDAIVGKYETKKYVVEDNILTSKMVFRVYAKDRDGNVVCSNDLYVDPARPSQSLTLLPQRIWGVNRIETSVNISKAGWPETSDTAVLATSSNFPDALSAAPLAKLYNAPILLTEPDKLDESVDEELDRLNVKKVIIVGGQSAVSASVEDYIAQKGISCRRISGKDRYDTSVEVAKDMGAFTKAVIATGEDFPDALSIAPFAAGEGIPIILTNKSSLPDSVQSFLASKKLDNIYVIGGDNVISDNSVSRLPNIDRVAGDDRYMTNLAVVNKFKTQFDLSNIYIATGEDFPDALSGSALAGSKRAPILLVNGDSKESVRDYISLMHNVVKGVNIIGGENAVDSNMVIELLSNN